jgi:RNA polymerase sigma-70 factor, ECF subfamily
VEAIKLTDYKDYKISDLDVVKRVISGEKELYEIIMRRNNQKIYRIVRGYLKSEDQIEDVMQNTYIRAFQKLYQFNQKSQLSTWLIRIAINESYRKIENNKKHLSLTIDQPEVSGVIGSIKEESLNPERKMIMKETKHIIETAIDALPEKYKIVYIMSEVEGMSLNEISKCIDISLSNTKVRIFRARKMLKERLYETSITKDVFEFGFSRCDGIVSRVMKLI